MWSELTNEDDKLKKDARIVITTAPELMNFDARLRETDEVAAPMHEGKVHVVAGARLLRRQQRELALRTPVHHVRNAMQDTH